LGRGRGGGGFLEAGGVGTGDGSCQGLIAWGDGLDLHQGTEWGVKREEVSRKQSGLCVGLECRGGVVEGE